VPSRRGFGSRIGCCIGHLVAVRPELMGALVAIVPLAKTSAWNVAVLEASRKAIMRDAACRSSTNASGRLGRPVKPGDDSAVRKLSSN
jgi:hypothetical protein